MIRIRSDLIVCVLLACLAVTPSPCRAQADGDPAILGTYRMVPSEVLGAERRIVVRLPQGYTETDQTYPVIYKLHGSSISFLGRIAGQLSLNAESGRIPEAILVGIEQHGHGEMLPRGPGVPEVEIHAEEFVRFLVDELVPFVERNYRTKDLRVLLGTYDCGLFAIYTLLTRPGAFDAYLASSPAFQRGGEIVIARAKEVFAKDAPWNATLHITHRMGAEGLAEPQVAEFLKLLESAAPDDLSWAEQALPLEAHDRWAPYVSHSRGLLAFFDGFECPADVLAGGFEATAAHFEILSRRLGAPFAIPEMTLVYLGDQLRRQNQLGEAIEAFEYLKQQYPNSLNAYFQLARAYRTIGDFDRSVENYHAALEYDRCPPSTIAPPLRP